MQYKLVFLFVSESWFRLGKQCTQLYLLVSSSQNARAGLISGDRCCDTGKDGHFLTVAGTSAPHSQNPNSLHAFKRDSVWLLGYSGIPHMLSIYAKK